ncbi:MAG: leucine-rich repeat domain-containing protein [Paludibacteraceae bacterium]|nr:leucine-rich repeat domain-containing protein [Paludibacteraceae bacterium]
MKKMLISLLVLLFSAGLYADAVLIDGLYYSLGSTTATLLKDQTSDKSVYSAYTSVTIPATVTYNNYTYPVVTIGSSAFSGCSNLQSVTLPNTITTINTDAFYGCVKLGSVNLPEGLQTIGTDAFYNCNLTSITIPSTVTSIGKRAFQGNATTSVTWLPADCSIQTSSDAPFYKQQNSTITLFTFGPNVQTVPSYICYGMSQLDTIVLPPSVTALGTYAFAYCTNLKSINLPQTQKTIPQSFLAGCSSLESIELPATVTTISSDAFYYCSKLQSINLPEGLQTISTDAFRYCKLSSITIPSTVTTISNRAFQDNPLTSVTWLPVTCSIGTSTDAPFYKQQNSTITSFTFGPNVQTVPSYICYGMSQLDTIVLPPSVTALGTYAFAYCTNLKSINLPTTQKTIPQGFLTGCSSLESIELPATVTTISSDAFYYCSKLQSINLPEGLQNIYSEAFRYCKLDSITIPSTVTSISNRAFQNNPLTKVKWLPVNCSIGSTTDAPFYSDKSTIASFAFGDQVEIIPNYLCYNMKQLDTVALPQNLKTIGNYAFCYCSALKGVEIPTSVTLLARNSFSYCPALKSFTFPEGLTTVATEVLEGCTALEEVFIPASVTTINSDAFYNCSGLMAIHNYAFTPQTINENTVKNVNKQTCILYVPMDYIDLYQQANVWKEFTNIIGVATDLQFEDQIVNVTYLKADSTLHYMESQTWGVPHEPRIEGFTFVGWRVEQGMLEDGIVLVAVYEANTSIPTQAPEVYVNPANKAQKLIRHGNVYILRDDKIYTIQGQTIK